MANFPIHNPQQLGLNGVFQPTVFAQNNFNPEADAERLYKAMKGIGTKESEVIAVLGKRTAKERLEIGKVFYGKYNKNLKKELHGETSGDFRKLLMLLVEEPGYVDAQGCYNAMKGAGTKERVLNQILLSRSNSELVELEEEYRQVLADNKQDSIRSLTSDIVKETSGEYERGLMVIMAKRRRELNQDQWHLAVRNGPHTVIDWDYCRSEARRLYAATASQQGYDERVVLDVVLTNNQWTLHGIERIFQEETGVNLYDLMYDELSGDIRNLILDALEQAIEQLPYYARLLRNTTSGLGTKDQALMRLIVSRSEIDLGSIMPVYEAEYKETLVKAVSGDTSGDYKKLLLALLGQ